jgi:hypothetical protein
MAAGLEHLLDHSMVRIGLDAGRILTLWDTEQDYCGKSEAVGFLAFLHHRSTESWATPSIDATG